MLCGEMSHVVALLSQQVARLKEKCISAASCAERFMNLQDTHSIALCVRPCARHPSPAEPLASNREERTRVMRRGQYALLRRFERERTSDSANSQQPCRLPQKLCNPKQVHPIRDSTFHHRPCRETKCLLQQCRRCKRSRGSSNHRRKS